MEKDNYLTTGELAHIMGISKHTLFHYDDIELFRPEIIKENGYRYYSIYQMETLDTILLLKDLGMSLKDIKTFLSHRSPQTILNVFQERKDQIDQQIRKLEHMKKWISSKEKKINEATLQDFSQITIKTYPQRYYISKKSNTNTEKEIYTDINELITEYFEAGNHGHYEVTYFQTAQNISKHIYNNYTHASLLLTEKPHMKNYHILPAGQYLTVYHVGHWETIDEAYERLLQYKEEHHIVTDQQFIEYYIVDNFMTDNMQEYVTEISIHIKPTNQK